MKRLAVYVAESLRPDGGMAAAMYSNEATILHG